MSKNTSSSEFRKIDVDHYCDGDFKEEDTVDISGLTGPDEAEITKLLNQYPLQYITDIVLNFRVKYVP